LQQKVWTSLSEIPQKPPCPQNALQLLKFEFCRIKLR